MRYVMTVGLLLCCVTAGAEYTVGIDSESFAEIATVISKYVDGPLSVCYESAVRKNIIVPIVQLAGVVVLWAAVITLLKTGATVQSGHAADSDKEFWDAVVTVIVAITALVCTIAWVASALPRLISPEYYAIYDIISLWRAPNV
jgi:hypothetical protein